MKHNQTIKELVTKTKTIRVQINDLILNLPDNKLAKKASPRCYIINSKNLLSDGTLAAETYDFRYQYEKIVEYLDRLPFEKIYDSLSFILKSKYQNNSYWLPMPNKNRLRLHPTVVKNVKKILEIT